jgi:hypothetical protein
LFYFAISFLWRLLVLEIGKSEIKRSKFFDTLVEAENEWRNFLLLNTYPRNYNQLHLIFTSPVEAHPVGISNVDYYLTRLLDGAIVYNYEGNTCSMYGKFSRFIFWAFLLGEDRSNMGNSQISPIEGVLNDVPNVIANSQIAAFIPNRIRQIESMSLASEEQQRKILHEMNNKKEHYKNSDLLNSIIRDEYLKKKK